MTKLFFNDDKHMVTNFGTIIKDLNIPEIFSIGEINEIHLANILLDLLIYKPSVNRIESEFKRFSPID